MSSPHPAYTIEEVRAMTKRHYIAQIIEDECDWLATMGQTIPPNDERFEEDMELSVGAMKPLLAWLDAVRELMIQRNISDWIEKEKWEAAMAARKDLLEGEAAFASWKLAREHAEMEAEAAKRATRGRGKKPRKAARRGSGGVPPTGNAPPQALGRNGGKGSRGVKEGDDASGDNSPLMPPVSSWDFPANLIDAPSQKWKRKLPAPREDKEEGSDNPRPQRRPRRSAVQTEAKIVTSPDIQEDALSMDVDLAPEAEEECDGNANPNSPAWTCCYYPKASGAGRGSTTRLSEKTEAHPAAGRSNGSHSSKTPQIAPPPPQIAPPPPPQIARPPSPLSELLPRLSSVSFDLELRELYNRLALVNIRLQNHVRATNETAKVIQSTIMDFGTTIMRLEMEEDEHAMRMNEGEPYRDE
ncbi:hypothetical protein EYR36_003132 [Pleurotus pulmonarius]|nr:hypothetical protein EYR36_003132 [Pleurotus pulmonarius]